MSLYGDPYGLYDSPQIAGSYNTILGAQQQPLSLGQLLSVVRDIQSTMAQPFGNNAVSMSRPMSQIPEQVEQMMSGQGGLMSRVRGLRSQYADPSVGDPSVHGPGFMDPGSGPSLLQPASRQVQPAGYWNTPTTGYDPRANRQSNVGNVNYDNLLGRQQPTAPRPAGGTPRVAAPAPKPTKPQAKYTTDFLTQFHQ